MEAGSAVAPWLGSGALARKWSGWAHLEVGVARHSLRKGDDAVLVNAVVVDANLLQRADALE